MLGARTIVIGHHDDWMPPVTGPQPDLSPLRDALSQLAPAAELRELAYLEPLDCSNLRILQSGQRCGPARRFV